MDFLQIIRGFFYRGPPTYILFWSNEMTDALKDYDLECRKCYPKTIIFNGKTYKYMNNIKTDSESF